MDVAQLRIADVMSLDSNILELAYLVNNQVVVSILPQLLQDSMTPQLGPVLKWSPHVHSKKLFLKNPIPEEYEK